MTVNMRMMMMLRQDQAEKWVRSRKRSPLPFIFVVPPSKDRFDIFVFLYSVFCFFIPLSLSLCATQGTPPVKKECFLCPNYLSRAGVSPPSFRTMAKRIFFRSKRAILRRKTIECTRRNRWPHLVREMWQKTKEIQADYSI